METILRTQLFLCRLCGTRDKYGELIRYTPYHYAHPICYLTSGKDLAKLGRAQLGKIPYQLVEQLGLWPRIKEIMELDDPDDFFLHRKNLHRIWPST